MQMYKNLLVISFLFMLSCNPGAELQGFDSQRWQEDENGCNGQRIELADEIINRKSEIMGLNENEISAVFGKPNRHELYSRNKKAYVYFIDGGPECDQPQENPDKVVIRFNGVGLAKDIILYKK